MGDRRDILCTVIVFSILVFGSVFEENILPAVESQLSTTLKITKLTTGGDDIFDFTVTGTTSYNPSIDTAGGGPITLVAPNFGSYGFSADGLYFENDIQTDFQIVTGILNNGVLQEGTELGDNTPSGLDQGEIRFGTNSQWDFLHTPTGSNLTSINLWFKGDIYDEFASGEDTAIISTINPDSDSDPNLPTDGFLLMASGNGLRGQIWENGVDIEASNWNGDLTGTDDGQWHMITLTLDNDIQDDFTENIISYIDTRAEPEFRNNNFTGEGGTANTTLIIGSKAIRDDNDFLETSYEVDDVTIWHGYKLTQSDIDTLYNAGVGSSAGDTGSNIAPSFQVLHVTFDETIGGGGMGMEGPTTVEPGTYSIQETIPAGWILTDATCNDGFSTFSIDTISGIVIDPGDNIECTFENEAFSPDNDFDGIYNTVDTLPDTSSDDFSDVSIGGTSSGTITTRGNQILTITEEPNPDGVRIDADISGGATPATVSVCAGASTIDLTPGDEIIVTCGSVTIDVTNGSVDVTFTISGGTLATTSITVGNSITFDPDTFSFVVPSTNNQIIVLTINGTEIMLSPGDTINFSSSLQIKILTTGGDGTFDFAVIGPSSSAISIDTASGMGMYGPAPVDLGTYSIQEIFPSGWSLADATCNDGFSSFSVDTVSGIVIDPGDNIECTFENEFAGSTDTDGDGILDDVDTLPNTISDDFSDISLGGTSSGTITTRGNQILTISEEPNPAGVRINADISGGLLPAVVSACGGISIITMSPGDDIVVTCGSATIDVINGPVDITFIGSGGTQATTSLTAGNSITFDQDNFSFSAPSTNVDPMVVIVEGEQIILYPNQAVSVMSSNKDSFLKSGESNTNEGINTMMRVRDSGNNRALMTFDQNAILTAAQGKTLQSATLRLYIEENGNNWGPNGRTIDVHRLLSNWSEGNGFNDKPASLTQSQFNALKTRGNGLGVTWECATDTEINNQQTNCSTQWNGASFNLTPTGTITIFKDNPPTHTVKTVGWIEFDVTSDLATFISGSAQNYGWIIKKTNEGDSGLVEFTSDEGTTNKPELVLVFG